VSHFSGNASRVGCSPIACLCRSEGYLNRGCASLAQEWPRILTGPGTHLSHRVRRTEVRNILRWQNRSHDPWDTHSPPRVKTLSVGMSQRVAKTHRFAQWYGGRYRIWVFSGRPTPFCAIARSTDWPTPSGNEAELCARATGMTAFG